ncbi:calcium-binding protein [Neogemmobacter tilapiae]|uniref:Calcium-binding protein n=1 Tax=Neogemmobacter tilapiae TaxID=875041 RepID=A0A918TN92_9RHOB|nr:calcium-binding protein [Gemmobacter tilapiae]GHC52613.1 hypothetical protein GCM10007315_13900 [Gemmobacter tilapiae]
MVRLTTDVRGKLADVWVGLDAGETVTITLNAKGQLQNSVDGLVAGNLRQLYVSVRGEGAALVTGGRYADNLTGGVGDDVLRGGDGNDVLYGGYASFYWDNGQQRYVRPNAGADKIFGGAGADFLTGAAAATLYGGAGDDLMDCVAADGPKGALYGGRGNDVLSASFGDVATAFHFEGGQGTDALLLDFRGSAAAGYPQGPQVVDFAAARGGVLRIGGLEASGFERLIFAGSDQADQVKGGALGDILRGEEGADHLLGGGGNDVFLWKHQSFSDSDGADYLDGQAGLDQLRIDWRSADGLLVTLTAEGDVQSSIPGFTAKGIEALRIQGDVGHDTMMGARGNDTFWGSLGDDLLSGGGGDDHLIVGLGHDTVMGGRGADLFLFNGQETTTISDFVSGQDKIVLNPIWGGKAGALAAGTFRLGKLAQDADDRLIYDRARGQLWLDADGNRAGQAVLLAQLKEGAALTGADIRLLTHWDGLYPHIPDALKPIWSIF